MSGTARLARGGAVLSATLEVGVTGELGNVGVRWCVCVEQVENIPGKTYSCGWGKVVVLGICCTSGNMRFYQSNTVSSRQSLALVVEWLMNRLTRCAQYPQH